MSKAERGPRFSVVTEPHIVRSLTALMDKVVVTEWTTVRVPGADFEKDVYKRWSRRSYDRRVRRVEKRAGKFIKKQGDEPAFFVDYPSVSEQTLS